MNSDQIVLEIDGAMGEGGGQVLRSALTLSICTGKAFRITRIRAARKKPGLQRQHLTAVRAARDFSFPRSRVGMPILELHRFRLAMKAP